MSPAAQKFYNLLLAHYLNDSTTVNKVKKYLTAKTKELRKKQNPIFSSIQCELNEDIKSQLDKLPDEDVSLVIKTFDIRMIAKTLEFTAETKDFITTLKLQPFQKDILNAFIEKLESIPSIGKDLADEE